jgi:hypothetical protein
MLDPISRFVMDHLIEVTSQLIMPVMVICFFAGIALRTSIYYIAKSEQKFSIEFFKRVRLHFSDPNSPKVASFSRLTRILLVKTFTDCFETKNRYKRRNLDYVTSLTERMFLIEEGVKRMIEDTLQRIRYLKKDPATNDADGQKLVGVSRDVFENNPFFNRLIGVFSVNLLNDLLNIMPSLFIIGGIFGTFLGISKSLPDLGGMDLSNMEETKRVMDLFLIKISQSMIKSIIGIAFSVATSILNTFLSVENAHYQVINKFTAGLELVWNETLTNDRDRTEVFPAEAAAPPAVPVKAA